MYATSVIAQIEASTSSTTTNEEKQQITDIYNLYLENGGSAECLYVANLSTPLQARNVNSIIVANISDIARNANMYSGNSSNMIVNNNYTLNKTNLQYIETIDNVTINNANFTLSAWINMTDGLQKTLFDFGTFSPRIAMTTNAQLYWNSTILTTTGSQYTTNIWHYVTLTSSQTEGYKFYKNGVEIATAPYNTTLNTTATFEIGKSSGTANYFDGSLNYLEFSTFVRTEQQITNIYNATKSQYGY